MKKLVTLACAFVIVAALVAAASAQSAKPAAQPKADAVKFLGKGDGVHTCPVTGEEIANKDVHATFFGREVYFCCAGCLAEVQKNPQAYIKQTEAAQIAAVKNQPQSEDYSHAEHTEHAAQAESKFLGKGDGIETCPVTGEAVNKNLKGEAMGRTFYVCCEGCLDTVKKNPEAYLKPLPAETPNEKKETAFLGKGDGINTCPVTGEPVDKALKAEVNGQTFYVCCADCIETVKANPAAYLKKPAKK